MAVHGDGTLGHEYCSVAARNDRAGGCRALGLGCSRKKVTAAGPSLGRGGMSDPSCVLVSFWRLVVFSWFSTFLVRLVTLETLFEECFVVILGPKGLEDGMLAWIGNCS